MAHEQEDGIMLQGADGDLYFIPAERMSEFRVADEDAVGVKTALEDIGSAEVSGFSTMQTDLKEGVSAVLAFQGPIGIKPPVTRINEGDGIWR